MFTLQSQNTLMGNRAHTVTTGDPAFAFALYEEALNIDIEPDFERGEHAYTIGFIAADTDCDAAITLALRLSAGSAFVSACVVHSGGAA